MDSTNRRWQKHLKAKGIVPFFMDRLMSHAFSSEWQYKKSPFYFPINGEEEDELTKAYFEMVEFFPYEFYIEITNSCNLTCKMCFREQMKRPLGTMSNETFNKIVDEIAVNQPYAYIHLYAFGESLLDEYLFKKLNYLKSKGLHNTILFSNGQLLLKNENYKKLVDSGVSTIGVDLDGFSQDTYGQIRIGGQFEIVKESIVKLYDYIREKDLRTRVEVAYQVYPGINEKEIPSFINWCNDNDYEYKLITMHNWGGLRSDIPKTEVEGLLDVHHLKRTGPCCALWSGFTIAWDGRVALCFQDADVREEMGDLNKQTIKEVWKGKLLEKQREHVEGNFRGICQQCDTLTEVQLAKSALKL